MGILSGAAPLIVDVRQTGSGPNTEHVPRRLQVTACLCVVDLEVAVAGISVVRR